MSLPEVRTESQYEGGRTVRGGPPVRAGVRYPGVDVPVGTGFTGAGSSAVGAFRVRSALVAADGRPVTVAHLAAEAMPYARTGGLGEVVASLARYQAATGIPTVVMLPLYAGIRAAGTELIPAGPEFTVEVGPRVERARLYQPAVLPSRPGSASLRIYFVDHPYYFDRPGLYGDERGDYPDNARRFGFFVVAALRALRDLVASPVVVHAHDWHTALAPVFLRTRFAHDPFFRDVRTVVSVHNAGYQGVFAAETLPDLGLGWELFDWRALEWYGAVNLLKGGLAFADAVTTVSDTHAAELRTAAGGFGLHQAFRALGARFVGITNGIDQASWDPATDRLIAGRYRYDELRRKRACRLALQRSAGLRFEPRVPIFAMAARLVAQKGLDLILGESSFFALDAQFVFMGRGDARYERALADIALRAPSRISVRFGFTDAAEHRLLAGADMCLMPSQYEPCGLTQMRAQRYGTIPIARRVGGLADTIEDGVTGFLFDDYTPSSFMGAVMRAIERYHDRFAWARMMREAMSRDFGWDRSAAQYVDVYRHLTQIA